MKRVLCLLLAIAFAVPSYANITIKLSNESCTANSTPQTGSGTLWGGWISGGIFPSCAMSNTLTAHASKHGIYQVTCYNIGYWNLDTNYSIPSCNCDKVYANTVYVTVANNCTGIAGVSNFNYVSSDNCPW